MKNIKSHVERALVPSIVQLTRLTMRTRTPSHLKRKLWQLANRNFFHHNAEIVAQNVTGDRMRCRTNDFVQKHILVFGKWEPTLTNYLLSMGSVDGIFLDIGANIGYFTLLASRQFSKVIAFEPSPSIHEELTYNVRNNNLENVVSFQVAIAAEYGEIEFYKSGESNIGASSVFRRADSSLESKVSCGPLEAYVDPIDWPRVRFVKIDVEGSELGVVRSLLRVAHLLSKDVEILVETNGENYEVSATIFNALVACGFTGYDLHSSYSLDDYLLQSPSVITKIHEVPKTSTDCLFRYS